MNPQALLLVSASLIALAIFVWDRWRRRQRTGVWQDSAMVLRARADRGQWRTKTPACAFERPRLSSVFGSGGIRPPTVKETKPVLLPSGGTASAPMATVSVEGSPMHVDVLALGEGVDEPSRVDEALSILRPIDGMPTSSLSGSSRDRRDTTVPARSAAMTGVDGVDAESSSSVLVRTTEGQMMMEALWCCLRIVQTGCPSEKSVTRRG